MNWLMASISCFHAVVCGSMLAKMPARGREGDVRRAEGSGAGTGSGRRAMYSHRPCASRRRPRDRSDELGDDRDGELGRRDGGDVAVADGRDRHRRPVPRDEELRPRVARPVVFRRVLHAVRDPFEEVVGDPVALAGAERLLHPPDKDPRAREPVAHEEEPHREADEALLRVRDGDPRLPAPESGKRARRGGASAAAACGGSARSPTPVSPLWYWGVKMSIASTSEGTVEIKSTRNARSGRISSSASGARPSS